MKREDHRTMNATHVAEINAFTPYVILYCRLVSSITGGTRCAGFLGVRFARYSA